MKIDFKDVKVGDYAYYSRNDGRYMICEIISLKSKFGTNYINSKVLESSIDDFIEEFNFYINDKVDYFTKKSDIDKILVFK